MKRLSTKTATWVMPLTAVVIFVVSQAAMGVILSLLKVFISGQTLDGITEDQIMSPGLLALGILISGIITAGILSAMKMINWRTVFSTRHIDLHTAIYSLAGAATGFFAINYAVEATDAPDTMRDTFIAMSSSWFCMLNIAVLGPIIEELVFREAIQGSMLRRGVKPWITIVVSAVIFGAIHFNWAQTLAGSCMGILLAVVYYKTGSTALTCIIHVANNSVAVAQMAYYGKEEAPSTDEMMGGTGIAMTTAVVCLAICLWTMQLLWRHKSSAGAPPQTLHDGWHAA